LSAGTTDPGAAGTPGRFVPDNTGNLVELVEPLEPADDERTTQS